MKKELEKNIKWFVFCFVFIELVVSLLSNFLLENKCGKRNFYNLLNV